MENKTAEQKQAEALALVEKMANDKAQEIATKAIEDLKTELAEKEKQANEVSEEAQKAVAKEIAKLQADIKKQSQIKEKDVKHTDSIQALKSEISSGLRESVDKLKGYSGGSIKLIEKAIAPADFGTQANYDSLRNTDLPMYANPYSPIYLRNIFPNVASSGVLSIWKRGTITGASAKWVRGTGDGGVDVAKHEVKGSWAKEQVNVDWIAGTTTVPREVLDDIGFLSTEIPNTLIYSASGIMAAENEMILDYLDTNSTAFTDATLTNGLEELLGAAFKLTGEYMTPTHMLINSQDYLKYLVLNKAVGSGEYDVPDGKVSFIGNQMFINNLIAVPTPGLTAGTAYVVDANQSRFVNRMNIELKMSDEHSDNFVKNMITFRAEERVGFFTYNDASILKVTLA